MRSLSRDRAGMLGGTAVAATTLLLVGLLPSSAPDAVATDATASPLVRGYLTTADLGRTLDRMPDRRFAGAPAPADAERILIDSSTRGQAITAGFGVAMTDTSAWLLAHELGPARRAEVLRRLFAPTGGIGLSFLRVPIGGSDYIVGGTPYTYDDLPRGQVDPELEHFSVRHDKPYVFPMIRKAMALNPGIRVMANPWTPPAWMKADGQLVSVGPLGTLLPQYYSSYADYLVRSVKAFRANGVPVHYLGVQNEPYTALINSVTRIPTSFLSGLDEARLIRDFLVPRLARAGLDPRIMAYDDGFQRSETFLPLVMAFAGRHVDGFAYHCYFSDPSSMEIEAALYPGREQLQTECSSYLSNVEPAQMTIRNLRSGASGVQLWNAVLDTDGGPKIGRGCIGITGAHVGQDCIAPVAVDSRRGTYTLTSDYWALAHFSRFIRRGATRIGSTSATCITSPLPPGPCGVETVAFENPDGSRALVVTSHDGRPHTISVEDRGGSFTARIPDGGTASFVWTPD